MRENSSRMSTTRARSTSGLDAAFVSSHFSSRGRTRHRSRSPSSTHRAPGCPCGRYGPRRSWFAISARRPPRAAIAPLAGVVSTRFAAGLRHSRSSKYRRRMRGTHDLTRYNLRAPARITRRAASSHARTRTIGGNRGCPGAMAKCTPRLVPETRPRPIPPTLLGVTAARRGRIRRSSDKSVCGLALAWAFAIYNNSTVLIVIVGVLRLVVA